MTGEQDNSPISEFLSLKTILLILLLSIFLGGNAVATKIALDEIAPFMNASLRAAIGAISILVWSLLSRQSIIPDRRELPYLIFVAAVLTSWLCSLNIGIKLSLASRASVFLNTRSVFAAILAHFFIPGDRLSYRKVIGLSIAFIGIILIFWDKVAGISSLGDAILLVSGFLLAVRAVTLKRISQHVAPNKILLWEMSFALIPLLTLSLIFEKPHTYNISTEIVISVLYQGVLVAGFSGIIWILLLRRYAASKLSIFLFATPIFGVVLSNLILGDQITNYIVIGTLLVASGIYIVNKCSRSLGLCG